MTVAKFKTIRKTFNYVMHGGVMQSPGAFR
jgi:hypothetical protein